MAGPIVTVSSRQVTTLTQQLAEISASGFRLEMRGFYTTAARSLQRIIERRYAESGPNTRGQRFIGILASSAAQRRNAPDGFKRRMRQIAGDIRVPVSMARPLMVTRAAMTGVDVTEQGARVFPTKDWAVYHHPTSFTGIGRGRNIDRGAHYISDKDEENAVVDLRGRLDRELARRMGSVERSPK